MPEINLPEVKLPEFKWADGLREMSRDDIVNAARDVRLPKKSDLPDIDLSKIELPKQISDRLPNRRRTNPILPIAGFVGHRCRDRGSVVADHVAGDGSPDPARRQRPQGADERREQ